MFVELDECQEQQDSLRSAISSAQNALHSKNLEISTLKGQKLILEQISGNKDTIIGNLNTEIKLQKGLKIGAIVLSVGFLVWAIAK